MWMPVFSYITITNVQTVCRDVLHACPCVHARLCLCVFDYSPRSVASTILSVWDDRGPSVRWEMSLQVHSCHFSGTRKVKVPFTWSEIKAWASKEETTTFVSAIQLAEESCILRYLFVSALCIKVFKATVLQKENRIITWNSSVALWKHQSYT